MPVRNSVVGTTTATTTAGALTTQAQADTPGACELVLDAESDCRYAFNAGVTAANGTRLYAGERVVIPILPGALCYVITASGTAVVRWTINTK